MPESIDFYEHKLEKAKEYHEGVKSGKYPREHAYTLTYAKKAVNEAQKNYELAKNYGRLSDEWCCMNCARLNECLMNEPDLNLLDYCVAYRDLENKED